MARRLADVFYWQGDKLADVTGARSRRALCVWLFEIFLVLFVLFPNAVWLVSAMSLVAILGIITGETPVESEEDLMKPPEKGGKRGN